MPGLEPGTTESKSVVLPLHHTPTVMNLQVVPPSLLAPFTWINKARAGLGKSLGILVQLATNLRGSSDPPGVEPVPFYYISPSKKPL